MSKTRKTIHTIKNKLKELEKTVSRDHKCLRFPQITETVERGDRVRLFLASFVGLFVELAFIRFIPAHVRVIGYYTNLVLIASFLGLGIGFLVSNRRIRLERLLIPLLLLTVLTVRFFTDVIVLNPSGTDEPMWIVFHENQGQATKMAIGPVVLIHFLLVTITLLPVGQVMGRLFGRFKRLEAYALDLGGSLSGVVFFGTLSALRTPPIIWFSLTTVIVISVLCRGLWERVSGLLLGILFLLVVWSMGAGGQIWSPYYMVQVLRDDPDQQIILTNQTLHQVMLNFDSEVEYSRKTKARFEIPYKMARSLEDVLIVGAGSGNDVAIAQAMGAKNIDAVEIDAVFPELGKQYHMQAPYDGDNVTLHITDARAFFKRSDRRYDLIVFGTLDSQALLGHLSSIRLDNYIYTREAFQEAHRLLKPEGLIAVFHMSLEPYIAERIYLLLDEAAGRPPQLFHFSDHILFNYLFIQGEGLPLHERRKEAHRDLSRLKISTDDWPFLYLRQPSIPWHYAQVLIGIMLIAILGTAVSMKGRLRAFDLRLFLLGAGFLMLETKSVTQMSLLFGSTWVVNLLVFSSILAILLVANFLVVRWEQKDRPINVGHLFGYLCIVLLAISFIPVSWIAGQHEVVRWVLGGAVVALPLGLAGLIFPSIFKSVEDPRIGFASNLLGAVLGGCGEYFTMWFGVRSLTLIAAIFYLVAAGLHIRKRK